MVWEHCAVSSLIGTQGIHLQLLSNLTYGGGRARLDDKLTQNVKTKGKEQKPVNTETPVNKKETRLFKKHGIYSPPRRQLCLAKWKFPCLWIREGVKGHKQDFYGLS